MEPKRSVRARAARTSSLGAGNRLFVREWVTPTNYIYPFASEAAEKAVQPSHDPETSLVGSRFSALIKSSLPGNGTFSGKQRQKPNEMTDH